MSTLSKAAIQDPAFDNVKIGMPKIHTAWILVICFLTSVWTWAAFGRHRGYSPQFQVAISLVALGAIAVYFRIASRALRLQLTSDRIESSRVLAFAACGFLLLVVFFPEYFMGGVPPVAKSCALLGISLTLSISYIAIASRN